MFDFTTIKFVLTFNYKHKVVLNKTGIQIKIKLIFKIEKLKLKIK